MRLALTTGDFERQVAFYPDGLGLPPSQAWPSDQGRGVVLDLGRATLELFDEQGVTSRQGPNGTDKVRQQGLTLEYREINLNARMPPTLPLADHRL